MWVEILSVQNTKMNRSKLLILLGFAPVYYQVTVTCRRTAPTSASPSNVYSFKMSSPQTFIYQYIIVDPFYLSKEKKKVFDNLIPISKLELALFEMKSRDE